MLQVAAVDVVVLVLLLVLVVTVEVVLEERIQYLFHQRDMLLKILDPEVVEEEIIQLAHLKLLLDLVVPESSSSLILHRTLHKLSTSLTKSPVQVL